MSNINDDSPLDDRPMNLSNVKKELLRTEQIYNNIGEIKNKADQEVVRLAFREGFLRGFNIKELPHYIRIKCNINVSLTLIYRLREMQLELDRKWFLTFAKDQYAYVSVYRECIDKIDSVENELWRIFMNPNVEHSVKVNASKEIHNLIRTRVLLLRDLPFIMNLSKYYDPEKMKDSNGNPLIKGNKSLGTDYDDIAKTIDNVSLSELSNNMAYNILKKYKDSSQEEIKTYNMDDDVMQEMEKQTYEKKDIDKIEKYEKSKTITDHLI